MSDNRDWIGRVRQADADAEKTWQNVKAGSKEYYEESAEVMSALSLISIAAELRAQRVSKRPGAGTATVPGAPTPL